MKIRTLKVISVILAILFISVISACGTETGTEDGSNDMNVPAQESDKDMGIHDEQNDMGSNHDEIDDDGMVGKIDEKDTPANDSDEQENSDNLVDNSDTEVDSATKADKPEKDDTADKQVASDKKDTSNKKDTTENKDTTDKTTNNKVTEFIGGGPEVHTDSVHINPKRVYYKDNSLIMVAWISNGHQTPVFNIHNVEIRVSNNEGIIAEGFFGELQGLQIGPMSSVEWTFVFSGDALIMNDADLGYLKTEYRNSYSY